ncbi:MAG: aminotransferase class V-fold PLP-dependent enzyme [Ignavibacteriales bacterium]|nr:aminotransferase class V-fold PLP-dependent enzyme [Ignavibacteriales bacterium]
MLQEAGRRKQLKKQSDVGTVNIVASTEEGKFKRIPKQDELKLDPQADYVHFTSNNTIYGTRVAQRTLKSEVFLLVCDASSDILHKKIDVNKYALIYAGAQKNIGPSGVTLVILRKDLLERSSDSLHTMLNYKTHVENDSLYNTPNTFGIYIIALVCKWLKSLGGLDGMYKINKEKADVLYNCIDESGGYYKGHADKDSRSLMNITFNLATRRSRKEISK